MNIFYADGEVMGCNSVHHMKLRIPGICFVQFSAEEMAKYARMISSARYLRSVMNGVVPMTEKALCSMMEHQALSDRMMRTYSIVRKVGTIEGGK